MLDKHNLNTEDFIAEFIVSADGKSAGVSIAGLARLCGVSPGTMNPLTQNLSIGSSAIKSLEQLRGKVFSLSVASNRDEPLVSHDAAADIIWYYADESTKVSQASKEIAKWSAKQFMKAGILNWIKEVTGYVEKGDVLMTTEAMQSIISSITRLEMKIDHMDSKGKLVKLVMPGLPVIQDQIEISATLPASFTHVTIREWIEATGRTQPNRSQIASIGNIASGTYRSLKGRDAKKVYKNGLLKGNGFQAEDYGILEVAYEKVMAKG